MSNAAMNLPSGTPGWSREEMARRAALDIPNGAYVNLGIGIPELVARFVPEGREVIYHTENGLLGMGPVADDGGSRRQHLSRSEKCGTSSASNRSRTPRRSGSIPSSYQRTPPPPAAVATEWTATMASRSSSFR